MIPQQKKKVMLNQRYAWNINFFTVCVVKIIYIYICFIYNTQQAIAQLQSKEYNNRKNT